MSNETKDLNIIELLMGIKEDVSSIKTDITNFKETQKQERENITKEIADVRLDFQKDLTELKSDISGIRSVQNNLVLDVDALKHQEDSKDANKWRNVVRFILVAFGGMILAKVPDFVSFCVQLMKGAN